MAQVRLVCKGLVGGLGRVTVTITKHLGIDSSFYPKKRHKMTFFFFAIKINK